MIILFVILKINKLELELEPIGLQKSTTVFIKKKDYVPKKISKDHSYLFSVWFSKCINSKNLEVKKCQLI